MKQKAGEAANLLNLSLGKLATRGGVDAAKIWEDEDGIYETLIDLKSEDTETEREQIFNRRLKNTAKRYGEFIKQPGTETEPRFIKDYGKALIDVAYFYAGVKDEGQEEAVYRLAFTALPIVEKSSDPIVFDRYSLLLGAYGELLLRQNRLEESKTMTEVANRLGAKHMEIVESRKEKQNAAEPKPTK